MFSKNWFVLITVLFVSEGLYAQNTSDDNTSTENTTVSNNNELNSKEMTSEVNIASTEIGRDSISKYKDNTHFDSIKVVSDKTIENTDKSKSEKEPVLEQAENDKSWFSISESEKDNFINGLIDWTKNLFIILISGVVIYFFVKKYQKLNKIITSLQDKNINLKNNISELTSKVQRLEKKKHNSKTIDETDKVVSGKSEKEIEDIRNTVKDGIVKQNTLDKSELKKLTSKQENRWVTVAHSSIGKNHTQANPPIPCQDNNHFEVLSDKWQLAIVCDGAGSAKMSHFGSKFISQGAIPNNLKAELSNFNWFKKGEFPSDKEWKSIGLNILRQSYDNLASWVVEQNKHNKTDFTVNDFASTVMLTLYNSKGVLVANIGDGRGGYLNTSGELKALFIPYGGDESNGTIFITSPIWDESENFIQTDVIKEELLSVFLLSDGMEKSTFECSNLTDDVFVDANIPYKKFFLPILSKIKSLNSDGEDKLEEEWTKLLESGSDAIKNEGDDKTLLVSFFK